MIDNLQQSGAIVRLPVYSVFLIPFKPGYSTVDDSGILYK